MPTAIAAWSADGTVRVGGGAAARTAEGADSGEHERPDARTTTRRPATSGGRISWFVVEEVDSGMPDTMVIVAPCRPAIAHGAAMAIMAAECRPLDRQRGHEPSDDAGGEQLDAGCRQVTEQEHARSSGTASAQSA